MKKIKTINGVRIKNIIFKGEWAEYLCERAKIGFKSHGIKEWDLFSLKHKFQIKEIIFIYDCENYSARADLRDLSGYPTDVWADLKEIHKYYYNTFAEERAKIQSGKALKTILKDVPLKQRRAYLKGIQEEIEYRLKNYKDSELTHNDFDYKILES
jgi:hypothetical protein